VGDGETGRQGDGETRGLGDKGTGRQGDREIFFDDRVFFMIFRINKKKCII
jgi:hypothetical protein